MKRRRFIALIGVAVLGLWLDGTGLIQLPRNMLIAISGRCSFCGKHSKEVFGLAGMATRPARICNECLDICLGILSDDPVPLPPPNKLAHAPTAPTHTTQAELDAMMESLRHQLDQAATARQRSQHDSLACSFCDTKQDEAKKLIAGPMVYICDRCVGDAASLVSLHS